MKVNEIFDSIQGEGPAMGQPATFVRLAGCNLKCARCDTLHNDFFEIGIFDIVDRINNKLVVVTGGEPTIHPEFDGLVRLLYNTGHNVDIETNGTCQISPVLVRIIRYLVVSPKRSNLETCIDYYPAFWKFVIGDEEWTWKIEDVNKFVESFSINNERVFLMPFGTDFANAEYVWDLCVSNNYRYSDRLQWRVGRK